MSYINFYFIHLNPELNNFSEEKSAIVNDVFENYQNFVDKDASLGEVRLFSFSPRDNHSYGDACEYFLPKMKDPCVLLTYSVFDLAPIYSTAFGRYAYLLAEDKIKAIYFVNYNKERDSSTYEDYLNRIFRSPKAPGERLNDRGYNPRSLIKKDKLIEAMKVLRLESPPVRLEDLSAISGINHSTLRNYLSRVGADWNGVDINPKQKKYLLAAMDEIYKEAGGKYDFLEETYIPKTKKID
ncbi:MAG: hypothetical protein E7A44_03070 [Peptoniphilus harei]|nr:hypothetical protein [Peptoniphilus harei]